ncbi:MAG TPA: PilT/PilU family type 4a pilus ATPase [Syntrophales bacterium]|nr:PilT/PilU family type 4a pilus ATPase [Syntrophales bacterium]HQQ27305.1 PilT/PilU family type 4a pilus ATPase [Syntrophales bacterium]
MKKFEKLISTAVQSEVSDIHIAGGHATVLRHHGRIRKYEEEIWTHEEVDRLVGGLLDDNQLRMLRSRQSLDFAVTVHCTRLRVNVFNSMRGLSVAVRLLPGTAPSFEDLNLHPSLEKICELRSGLVLICGATGTGKTTTIAALVERINQTRTDHIITLEDPIEFRFQSKCAFVEQRELGTHVISFEQGLLDALREDPDVIVVGELRERATMRLTLNAAEAGNLVIATLHATNPEDAVYRLCNAFPMEAQEEVRSQLASTLQWLIVQNLVFQEKLGYRLPMLSILRNTQPVKGIIRDNKLFQLESTIQMGKADGMFTRERYIKDFLNTREQFTPPSRAFQPSEEVTRERLYRSPLMAGAGNPGEAPARDSPEERS